MNRRHRKRKYRNRAQHAKATRTPDRPTVLVSGENLPRVENSHIVPRMYQRAWEGDHRRVAVHRIGQDGFKLLSTKRAGARPAFYRRTRPQGTEVDDFEASLAALERRATKPLRELITGEELTAERKGVVAQFLAVQMMRSPNFFIGHADCVDALVDELRPQDFKRADLRSVDGDLERARTAAREALGKKTNALTGMVSYSMKVGSILAHMRWHVLRFDEPLLAYSDQPVVLWPMRAERAKPFQTPCQGPLGMLEIRAPLAPDVAVLMSWSEGADLGAVPMGRFAAGDLNAFTVSQADREWMHTPGFEPEIPNDIFSPLSRRVDPAYDRDAALRSKRRSRAKRRFERIRSRTWVEEIEVLTAFEVRAA